jgi:large repetitive protein
VPITVVTAVPPVSIAGSLADTATVTSSTDDPNPSNDVASAASAVERDARLTITKTPSATSVTPGGAVSYEIVATNAGPSTAFAVTVTDAVTDPGILLTSATSDPPGLCSTDGNNARCTIAALAPGADVTMQVNATALPGATPGSTVGDGAVVSSATPDSVPGDNEALAAVTIGPAASTLTIAKTADAPAVLVAGRGEVRYTIDVVNGGPSDADPVTVTDVLPAGFVVRSATTDRGSCDVTPAATGDTVACDVGRLVAPFGTAGGARASVLIVATVAADVDPGDYDNVATVSAPSSSPVTSPAAPVTVAALANVSVIKSFPADTTDPSITPGAPKTYRIRVVNDGPSVAHDVQVTDDLPDGLTSTGWHEPSVTPPGPTPVCDDAAASCLLGDLPPGTTVELELDVLVDAGLVIDPDVGVVNTATVTSTTPDLTPADNESTFTASGGAQADLSIRKIPPSPDREIYPVPAPVAGTNTSYVLEVVNFGPSDAPNIVITDVLPLASTSCGCSNRSTRSTSPTTSAPATAPARKR